MNTVPLLSPNQERKYQTLAPSVIGALGVRSGKMKSQQRLFSGAYQLFPKEDAFLLHTHHFVSGPRSGARYRNGKWDEGTVTHSHLGGNIPHTHPDSGPSCYGYHHKSTKKPKGEQGLQVIPRTEEENTFDLIVTDSALVSIPFAKGGSGQLVPIGDAPIEILGFPAARAMSTAFGMKCVIRDERSKATR